MKYDVTDYCIFVIGQLCEKEYIYWVVWAQQVFWNYFEVFLSFLLNSIVELIIQVPGDLIVYDGSWTIARFHVYAKYMDSSITL